MARRGHASMAVASAVGSQVINVLVGLGVPWLITAAAGQQIAVRAHAELQVRPCTA